MMITCEFQANKKTASRKKNNAINNHITFKQLHKHCHFFYSDFKLQISRRSFKWNDHHLTIGHYSNSNETHVSRFCCYGLKWKWKRREKNLRHGWVHLLNESILNNQEREKGALSHVVINYIKRELHWLQNCNY